MKAQYAKSSIFSFVFVLLAAVLSAQSKYTVNTTTSNTFDPETLYITIGDTVEWVWGGGSPHTTTSDATSGPDVWNANLNATNPTYAFVISMVGNHPYHCMIHGDVGGIGMSGLIVVNPTGIEELEKLHGSHVIPNPFRKKGYIAIRGLHYDKAELYGMDGKIILTMDPVQTGSNTFFEVNIPDYPNGIYFYRIYKDGQAVETNKLVKSD